MAALSPDEIAAGKTATLVAFVQRARRIQTHSLTQDQDALCALKYMIGGMISAHPDGTVTEIKALPPQEMVESAAALVRPVLLNQDDVHWGKVLKALEYFVHEHAGLMADVKNLRGEWQKIMPKDGKPLGYSLMLVSPVDPKDSRPLTDSTMAESWFYGDLVHAKRESQAKAAHVGITERYRAAVSTVANAVWLTMTTLVLVDVAQKLGLVSLPKEALTVGVVPERLSALWGQPDAHITGEQA